MLCTCGFKLKACLPKPKTIAPERQSAIWVAHAQVENMNFQIKPSKIKPK